MTGIAAVCLLVSATDTLAGDVVDFAATLIGRPYVWGAEGPDAFDCSGLTQYVYQQFGIDLPRRAISQSQIGDSAGRTFQRGDLLFFSTDSDQSLVTHVGIYEGGGVMIDASKRHGKVRRDDLDDPFWVERFLFARRVSDANDRVIARRDDRPVEAQTRSGDKKRIAARVLEQAMDVLLKVPRR
jgi:NlpC/P60 family protein